jgi:hypothetical protein
LLQANRENLIGRCALKVSQRSAPQAAAPAEEPQYGVPVILDQLFEALVREQARPTPQEDRVFGYESHDAAWMECQKTSALHGTELFALGYTVEQVVYGYGDVCQAITELADESGALITVDEFHTLNGTLDSSIANAVSAYVRHQHAAALGAGAKALHERLGALGDEQRVHLDAALKALDTLKLAGVGSRLADVMEESLLKLRDLIDCALPEIRVASGMVSP